MTAAVVAVAVLGAFAGRLEPPAAPATLTVQSREAGKDGEQSKGQWGVNHCETQFIYTTKFFDKVQGFRGAAVDAPAAHCSSTSGYKAG